MTDPFLGSISPNASILDPMGYTRTSFLDPSPVSSTPRPAALLGTHASAFNDAGGFISFARSSPAQAPWDPLGMTSEAADDGDPSYDPRLLSLTTPETAGDDDVDPVLAYYQKEVARADASKTPEALQTLGRVNIAIKNALKFKFDSSGWQAGVQLASGLYITENTWITVITYAGTLKRFMLKPGEDFGKPAGWSSIDFATDIPGTNIVQPISTQRWILLPTKATETAARSALKWGQQVPHLRQYLPNQHWGEAGPKALMHHYGVYTAASKIIYGRELPGIVANGQLYFRQTFFGALGRLGMVVEFQGIANQITREANGRYSSLAQLVVTDDIKTPDFLGSGHNLTAGTAALAGFIYNHDEVSGHRPLDIIGANGKWLRQNYDFSIHVRRALVYWGNVLAGSSFVGNLKSHVQASVRKAAQLTNLHHFFDGKNDPWSGSAIYEPSHPRGRELSENRKQSPNYPFEGRRTPENNLRLAEIIRQIDQNDIPEIVDRVHRAFLGDNPTTFGQLHRLQIEVEARKEARRVLVPLIMDLIAIPGVVVGQNLQDPISEELINRVIDGPGPVPSGPNLRAVLEDALRNYIASPWEPNRRAALDTAFLDFMERADEAFDFAGRVGLFAGDFRAIVNTLIMGGEVLYGAELEGNPYGQYARMYNYMADAQVLGGAPMDVRAAIARYACRHARVRQEP
jgi:hypothetical protein